MPQTCISNNGMMFGVSQVLPQLPEALSPDRSDSVVASEHAHNQQYASSAVRQAQVQTLLLW